MSYAVQIAAAARKSSSFATPNEGEPITVASLQRDVGTGLCEEDLSAVPDVVLRWMARYATENDLAVVGGALCERRFGAL
jgi:hypothetical protein